MAPTVVVGVRGVFVLRVGCVGVPSTVGVAGAAAVAAVIVLELKYGARAVLAAVSHV